MRENRLSGSEGGGTEANQFLLPLSDLFWRVPQACLHLIAVLSRMTPQLADLRRFQLRRQQVNYRQREQVS